MNPVSPRLLAALGAAVLLLGCANVPEGGGYRYGPSSPPAVTVYETAPVYPQGYYYPPPPPPRYVPYPVAPAPVYVQPRPVWIEPPARRPYDRDDWRERERERDRDRAERDRWARERDLERARREMADRMARPAPSAGSPGRPPGGYPPSDWRSRQYSNQGETGAGP